MYDESDYLSYSTPNDDKLQRFATDLVKLINIHSLEQGSNTPDFILAGYLIRCLQNFETTSFVREQWYKGA